MLTIRAANIATIGIPIIKAIDALELRFLLLPALGNLNMININHNCQISMGNNSFLSKL
jgi:hypothetical protein